MARVKTIRPYDSRGRLERSERNRDKIIEVAREAFLRSGYASTTVAEIAFKAGVSVETVYKGFGSKPGLVRAIYERGLKGRGATPAYDRSDAMKARETDPREIARATGVLAAEVSQLVSPILLLVRAAAEADPDLAALLRDSEDHRLERMRLNARSLSDRGFLRKGMSIDKAADIMWMLVAPELYDLLVNRRGWTPQQFGEHVASTMAAQLLSSPELAR